MKKLIMLMGAGLAALSLAAAQGLDYYALGRDDAATGREFDDRYELEEAADRLEDQLYGAQELDLERLAASSDYSRGFAEALLERYGGEAQGEEAALYRLGYDDARVGREFDDRYELEDVADRLRKRRRATASELRMIGDCADYTLGYAAGLAERYGVAEGSSAAQPEAAEPGWYEGLDALQVRVKGRGAPVLAVQVALGYSAGDADAAGTIEEQKEQVAAFVRKFFASRHEDDLRYASHAALQLDLMRALNRSVFQSAVLTDLAFRQFSLH